MTKKCDNKSVGMLVWRDGSLLLIERRKPPFGFAPPAGHIDGDDSFEESAKRELKEEVGLEMIYYYLRPKLKNMFVEISAKMTGKNRPGLSQFGTNC